MSTRHRHRWQRLSDVALFCECGQTKEVGAPTYPIHLCSHPCTLRHYPDWTYYPAYPWTPTFTTGETTSFDATGITVWNG